MSKKDMTEEVREFLAAYDEAFRTFDGSRIAPFYCAPCVTVRGDGSVYGFQTRSEIEEFFGRVAQTYRADGFHGGTFHDLEVIPIGSRSLLATLTWEQLRADKSVLRKWRQSYNLIQTESGWQILAATFHLN